MFRTWITKQVAVAHFNGTNRQLSWWDKLVKNVCPNCQQAGESTSHIKRCTAIGHQTIFKESVGELRIWLQKEQTDQVVTKLICKYLEGHGETTMESLLVCKDSKYAMVVWIHDKLGWDNFLEGRGQNLLSMAPSEARQYNDQEFETQCRKMDDEEYCDDCTDKMQPQSFLGL
jgi:hypothetical protein